MYGDPVLPNSICLQWQFRTRQPHLIPTPAIQWNIWWNTPNLQRNASMHMLAHFLTLRQRVTTIILWPKSVQLCDQVSIHIFPREGGGWSGQKLIFSNKLICYGLVKWQFMAMCAYLATKATSNSVEDLQWCVHPTISVPPLLIFLASLQATLICAPWSWCLLFSSR